MDTVYGTISQPFFVSSNTDLHKLPYSISGTRHMDLPKPGVAFLSYVINFCLSPPTTKTQLPPSSSSLAVSPASFSPESSWVSVPPEAILQRNIWSYPYFFCCTQQQSVLFSHLCVQFFLRIILEEGFILVFFNLCVFYMMLTSLVLGIFTEDFAEIFSILQTL